MNKNLWSIEEEKIFFISSLKNYATEKQLFYNLKDEYYAYIPKNFDSEGQTLQARNSLIGHYTEHWVQKLLQHIANKFNLYAVNNVICEEISLSKQSSADIAFCKTPQTIQEAKNIKVIFEIKMSIVWNYLYKDNIIKNVGDYKAHKGNPSLLRSDSMLKAIGKAVNIRVSGDYSRNIPIIVLGNSPITEHYKEKVDFLKEAGIIQQFISLNPNPTDTQYIKETNKKGFITAKDFESLYYLIEYILKEELCFFHL
ncbi:MAG: hypothetical protein LBF97_04695 [Elusimicrobiota bacterium]|nr:hypothetical protein [Elusimicrobiota bacterium]